MPLLTPAVRPPLALAAALLGCAAIAAPPTRAGPRSGDMPPPAAVLAAARLYAAVTSVRTSHAGWREAAGYVNAGESVRLEWHVERGGSAELLVRDAWDPAAPMRELFRWRPGRGERGKVDLAVSGPTLLRLRVRAARWPRSGVSGLRASYARRTVAVLRGSPGAARRPVILAEGYDPLNDQDLNDTARQQDPTLARLASLGRERYNLDLWLLDWGDAGAPLERQAEDFADIAGQVRGWNGGRRATVAAGISMGAVSIRRALAAAAAGGRDLGVARYLSINGPHRGAWINPDLLRFVLRRARAWSDEPGSGTAEPEEPLLRALDSGAARELLIGGPAHEAFYASLRSLAAGGYDPRIPSVAFSNGTLVREGAELEEIVRGGGRVSHRVLLRPLWLPVWITIRRTPREFRYGAYPGELLPASLRTPIRTHLRLLGLFRLDFRGRWESIPTFIPTHSALDFPDTLVGGPNRFRYGRWRETPFSRVYVARGRNLAHDDREADWIDPATGEGPAGERNAILYEAARAFSDPSEAPAAVRRSRKIDLPDTGK